MVMFGICFYGDDVSGVCNSMSHNYRYSSFEVATVNWPSASLKFYWQKFGLYQSTYDDGKF